MAEQLEPLRRIQARAVKILNDHGVAVHAFNFSVEPTQGIQALCRVDPDWEPPKETDVFDEIVADIDQERTEKVQEIEARRTTESLTDLRDQLRDPGKGIL